MQSDFFGNHLFDQACDSLLSKPIVNLRRNFPLVLNLGINIVALATHGAHPGGSQPGHLSKMITDVEELSSGFYV